LFARAWIVADLVYGSSFDPQSLSCSTLPHFFFAFSSYRRPHPFPRADFVMPVQVEQILIIAGQSIELMPSAAWHRRCLPGSRR